MENVIYVERYVMFDEEIRKWYEINKRSIVIRVREFRYSRRNMLIYIYYWEGVVKWIYIGKCNICWEICYVWWGNEKLIWGEW